MKAYVFVDAPGVDRDADLDHWLQAGLSFVGTLAAK